MALADFRKPTNLFLNWNDTDEGRKPFFLRIIGEPEKTLFKQKERWNLKCQVPGGQQTLTCSQSAMNALVDAAEREGVLDKADTVVWKAWKTGDKYETRYHWEIAKASEIEPVVPNGLDADMPF